MGLPLWSAEQRAGWMPSWAPPQEPTYPSPGGSLRRMRTRCGGACGGGGGVAAAAAAAVLPGQSAPLCGSAA
eukprot:1139249-Pelagomonas_calceolata.AAC.3